MSEPDTDAPALSLSDVSTPRLDGETFRLEVPAGWRQGRGAFGGLTIGAALRAIEARAGDPLRDGDGRARRTLGAGRYFFFAGGGGNTASAASCRMMSSW